MIDELENTKGRNTMQTLVGSSDFPTTRWTLVVAAADPQRKEAHSALVSLCEGYWYPLYAYVRRRGYAGFIRICCKNCHLRSRKQSNILPLTRAKCCGIILDHAQSD